MIYGDGRQVRDVLYVDDLVEAFRRVRSHIERLAGSAFNMGGGPARAISLLELIDLLEPIAGSRLDVRYESWRTGDQKYYVSDTRRFSAATGWRAVTDVGQGVHRLANWLMMSGRLVAAERMAS